MPTPGPWITAPSAPGLTATATDYSDGQVVAWQNVEQRSYNSEDPGNFSDYDHDPALSFTKASHGSDPLVDVGSVGGLTPPVAGVWGMREPWRGAIAEWATSASRVGLAWFPIENAVYRYNPPVWPAGALDIEYEYAPGTGIPDDGSVNRLYLPSGVTNVHVEADGFIANAWGPFGGLLHGFAADLEVRIAPGTPTGWTTSGSSLLIPDFAGPTPLTPEALTAASLLASITIPAAGDSVYDPTTDTFLPVDANTPFDLAFDLPDTALPRTYVAPPAGGPAVEVYFAVDHHSTDTAPPVGDESQSPTWPHGDLGGEYAWREYWATTVSPTGDLDDGSHRTIRAIYHYTFDFQPARYRFLFAVAPPQRQFPRDDGLGISTRRSWPPPTTKQYGLRRGPVGTVL